MLSYTSDNVENGATNLDDAQGLVDRGLGVEGVPGIDLSGNLAGDDLQNLLAKLDKEAVEGLVNLLVDVTALGLGDLDGLVDQTGILGLLGGGKDKGRVGGGILGLVLSNGW